MRYWVALFAILSLAGCKTIEQVVGDADDAKCRAYGALKGTPEYTQCRVALDTSRQNAAATASVGHAINNQNLYRSTEPGWLHRPY